MRVSVSKWYLDCSSPDDAAAVIYLGRVSIGWFSAPYCEVLIRGGSGSDVHVKRLSARATITEHPDRVALDAPALGISGAWMRRAPAIGATLIDDRTARIAWRGEVPRAEVSLQLPGGRVVEGAGYAEHLSFDGTTAGLPFRQLRWGRFIGGDRHVVWIDWEGGLARRWVWVDGRAVDATVVTRESVAWPLGRLDLDPGLVLRHARVAETVAGRLGRWLPPKLAGAMETKWASQARLVEDPGATSGRAIHEVVRWA